MILLSQDSEEKVDSAKRQRNSNETKEHRETKNTVLNRPKKMSKCYKKARVLLIKAKKTGSRKRKQMLTKKLMSCTNYPLHVCVIKHNVAAVEGELTAFYLRIAPAKSFDI